ncbi:13895_t:CDS:2, partial [Racocetra persica]
HYTSKIITGEVPNEIGTNVKQFTSVYILKYKRESDIDFVLSPVLDKDIPEHLQRRLNEVKALYKQRRKEAEERFDLANIDNRQYPISEVTQFMVLK